MIPCFKLVQLGGPRGNEEEGEGMSRGKDCAEGVPPPGEGLRHTGGSRAEQAADLRGRAARRARKTRRRCGC